MLEKLEGQLRCCQRHGEEITQLRDQLQFITNLLMLMPYGIRTDRPGVIPPRQLPRARIAPRPKQRGHL